MAKNELNFENKFNFIECKDVNILLSELKTYINSDRTLNDILEAYEFAEKMHRDQKRKSGEPYIIHPLSTAYYLAQWKMDPNAIMAGLLHDVIEDTPVTYSELENKFGTDVANLVESVTKVSYFAKENRAQMKTVYLRKLFLSMVKDIRVIIIKIADRMHNLLTLEFMTPEKQKLIAQESLDIYSSIAYRIGMKGAKNILEDYSFKILSPEEYNKVERLLEDDKEERLDIIKVIISDIHAKLKFEHLLQNMLVFGRTKTIYSIYRKISIFGKNFSDINDIIAVRVICDKPDECYLILGWVHKMYTPLSGRFKDYISTPKNNLYQSLHSTLISKDGVIFEIQIRTHEMDEVAERGAAAHWKYKDGENKDSDVVQKELDKKIDMFNRLINLEKSATSELDEDIDINSQNDSSVIEETVKKDFLTPSIYVLTPDSTIITLPFGSTVIDFAFKIHTDIGLKAIGAKINGVFSPINTTLDSGEIVEIQTSDESEPQHKWLRFARTVIARKAIQKFLDDQKKEKEENENLSNQQLIRKTKKEIDEYIINHNLKMKLNTYSDIEKKIKVLDFNSIDEFLLSIGRRDFTVSEAVELVYTAKQNNLTGEEINDIKTRKYRSKNSRKDIIVNGSENVELTLANCCYPLPPESISAYIFKNKGIQIHRDECVNVMNNKNSKSILPAEWAKKITNPDGYLAKIRLLGDDTPGLLALITKVFAQLKVEIEEMNVTSLKEEYIIKCIFSCKVNGLEQIIQLLSSLRNVPGVLQTVRVITTSDN